MKPATAVYNTFTHAILPSISGFVSGTTLMWIMMDSRHVSHKQTRVQQKAHKHDAQLTK
jgi:hypothetical protein